MSDQPPISVQDSVKKRQRLLLWTLISLGGIVALAGVYFVENGPTPPPAAPKPVRTNIAAPGSQVKPADAWRTQADAQLKGIEDQVKHQNKDFGERMNRLEKLIADGQASPKGDQDGLTATPPPPQQTAAGEPRAGKAKDYIQREKEKLQEAAMQGGKRLPPPNTGRGTASTAYPPSSPLGIDGAAPETPQTPGITIVSFDSKAPAPTADPSANGKPESAKGKTPAPRKTVNNYLPGASHMPVESLGGLDAPTGGQAQSDALPIYLLVTDNAFLPNHFRSRTKQCHVIGTAYGNLSSERAIPRAETLSCVMTDGSIVEATIKATVYGEDGKVGFHGKVVQKTGQILANALMSGVASGIGHAFQQSATTQSVSPLGTTSTVDTGKQFQAGLGAGVGNALTQLSQYYIRLADKTFPVVEVLAGRKGDMVIQKGAYVEFSAASEADDTQELNKRYRRMNRHED